MAVHGSHSVPLVFSGRDAHLFSGSALPLCSSQGLCAAIPSFLHVSMPSVAIFKLWIKEGVVALCLIPDAPAAAV
jgi:hypothetical protein